VPKLTALLPTMTRSASVPPRTCISPAKPAIDERRIAELQLPVEYIHTCNGLFSVRLTIQRCAPYFSPQLTARTRTGHRPSYRATRSLPIAKAHPTAMRAPALATLAPTAGEHNTHHFTMYIRHHSPLRQAMPAPLARRGGHGRVPQQRGLGRADELGVACVAADCFWPRRVLVAHTLNARETDAAAQGLPALSRSTTQTSRGPRLFQLISRMACIAM
jgi:hypothetical protein